MDPVFTDKEVLQLDKVPQIARTLDGKQYVVGAVGINNLKANDYINVWLQVFTLVLSLLSIFLLCFVVDLCSYDDVARFFPLAIKL